MQSISNLYKAILNEGFFLRVEGGKDEDCRCGFFFGKICSHRQVGGQHAVPLPLKLSDKSCMLLRPSSSTKYRLEALLWFSRGHMRKIVKA